jgi:hypothetical protein
LTALRAPREARENAPYAHDAWRGSFRSFVKDALMRVLKVQQPMLYPACGLVFRIERSLIGD